MKTKPKKRRTTTTKKPVWELMMTNGVALLALNLITECRFNARSRKREALKMEMNKSVGEPSSIGQVIYIFPSQTKWPSCNSFYIMQQQLCCTIFVTLSSPWPPTNKTNCPSSDTVTIYGQHILPFMVWWTMAIFKCRAKRHKKRKRQNKNKRMKKRNDEEKERNVHLKTYTYYYNCLRRRTSNNSIDRWPHRYSFCCFSGGCPNKAYPPFFFFFLKDDAIIIHTFFFL